MKTGQFQTNKTVRIAIIQINVNFQQFNSILEIGQGHTMNCFYSSSNMSPTNLLPTISANVLADAAAMRLEMKYTEPTIKAITTNIKQISRANLPQYQMCRFLIRTVQIHNPKCMLLRLPMVNFQLG